MTEALPRQPRDPWGRLILVAIAVIGVLVAIEWMQRPQLPSAGSDAPRVAFALLDGDEPVDLAAWRGKVVLLDFWATWCPPCVESMPVVHKVAADLADEGVVAVAVNGDDAERREELVRHFLRKHQLEGLSVALDDGSAARAFSVTALPTMVVIGRDGRVAGAHLGALDEATLRALLAPALAASVPGS
ncbi:TlpA family protein disulfide reductase [Vulgatibacter sp.]|uniref:TlpA family protein disulfide reductase n=1 Tax=Vulgatibacter sp. TaxID=1971226 RepID=UPI0035619CF9